MGQLGFKHLWKPSRGPGKDLSEQDPYSGHLDRMLYRSLGRWGSDLPLGGPEIRHRVGEFLESDYPEHLDGFGNLELKIGDAKRAIGNLEAQRGFLIAFRLGSGGRCILEF